MDIFIYVFINIHGYIFIYIFINVYGYIHIHLYTQKSKAIDLKGC